MPSEKRILKAERGVTEPFLRGFLRLKGGLSSHDTFSRLFRRLDPEQFRATFRRHGGIFRGKPRGYRH